ncbi:MAG: FtsQ-type POTRA domain-containing protein [Acidimicrobiales bacterium]
MTDPRIQARRVRVERQRGHRRLGLLLSALAAAGASAGAVAILHSSLFSARTVAIAGAVHTPRSEILEVSGLDRRPPLIDVDPAAIERRLDRLPWVSTAAVQVHWPSTVDLDVVERVPVATSPLEGGGFAVLDSTGRVLADQAARPAGLPLVALAKISSLPGSSLGPAARPLLAAAAQLPVSLLPRVQEIAVSGSDGIVLHLEGGLRAVIGDDEALAEKFVSLATVLSRVNLAGIGAIDLRVAASPVLTPLVTASNVQGKGDG